MEDLAHFLIHCKELEGVRKTYNLNLKEYIREEEEIGNFLFKAERIEHSKEALEALWIARQTKLKNIKGNN